MSQQDDDRAARFRALHERDRPFLLPNPWDAGTARLLAHHGFEALGTTSLGVANALGLRRAGREAILANCRAIAAASPLPVTADLENGFGAAPEAAAQAIQAAVASPEVIEAFAPLGIEAGANTPEELARAVKAENEAWGPIVKRVGFTPEA